MLRGFTPPYTPRGASSLVPRPPWHYAGWLLSVEFECEAAGAFVPEVLGEATGRGTVHFADWQATTDGSELLDPVVAQYRETIVLLQALRPDGTAANYCPFIYVDQDVSLLRGLLQGWPKKHGSTWLTRSLPLDHPAAAPLREGTRLGATLAAKDRRLAEARLTLTGRPGRALGFAARPTFATASLPDLTEPARESPPRLLRAAIAQRVGDAWHEASGELAFHASPRDELSELGLRRAVDASAGYFAITVTGATPL